MDSNEQKLLMLLLSEQLGVLAKIDTNSSLGIEDNSLRRSSQRVIETNKLIALEMSKKMAHACRMITWYMNGKFTKDEAKKVLLAVLDTDFGHPYAVSAKWNLNAMYNVLEYGQMHGSLDNQSN